MDKQAEVIEAGGGRYTIKPNNGKSFTLKELQEIVGGTIDIQKLPEYDAMLVVNDNGKLEGLPRNEAATRIWQDNYPIEKYPYNNDELVVGTVLLVWDKKLIK